ncbi:MAG: FprA family A-type flavoprotein [Muribaculaceae bacterium]
MSNVSISDAVRYIGVDDHELDLFEGQYIIPNGIAYNSYVILDEKTAILDTVDARFADQWLANLEAQLQGKVPQYLIISHMEPDHSSVISRILDLYPNLTGVCSARALPMMKRFFTTDYSNRMMVVNEGDTLALGAHTLKFFMAPMVHWPEVMVAYEQEKKILFSADAFGKFGALDADEAWTCEARRYYFNICGKYGAQVQALLKKAALLDIRTICPLHGPILSENLEYYIDKYNTWSSYEAEDKGIFIAYCSLHGNTAKAALALADIIATKSDIKVATADIARDDMAEALEDAFRHDRLVLAAPTYDGGIMPVMDTFLHHLASKNFQNRTVGIIENGSWAPMAGRKMCEMLQNLKNINILQPIVTVESTVKDSTLDHLTALAEQLLQ